MDPLTTTIDGVSFSDSESFVEALADFSKGGTGPGNEVHWDDIEDKPSFGDLAEKDNVSVSDIEATGTPSSTTYMRGDGTWSTPTNTTYAVITEAEFNTGSATTGRTVSAVSLNRDIQSKVISYLQSLDGFAAGAVLTVNATEDGFEWIPLQV